MADASHRGEFVWHDLLTPNAAGAHEFYGKVVHSKTQPWESDPNYVLFAARRGPVGGVMESRAATPHSVPIHGRRGMSTPPLRPRRASARPC